MTQTETLNTPWSLHFDRDGTEDYGIICDAEGNDLVASHLPQTNMPRWKNRGFGEGCFWLPESEGDRMPLLVRQMQVMAASPNLRAMLKTAIATADPAKHKWVKEARQAIAEATGQEYDAREAEETWALYMAARRLYAALEVCEVLLRDYQWLVETIATKLAETNGSLPERIEKARREVSAALCEARGEIAV